MARRKVAKEKEVPFELLADFERSIKFNKRNFRRTRLSIILLYDFSYLVFHYVWDCKRGY